MEDREETESPTGATVEDHSPYTAENREEKTLVSLGGTATTISGKLTRSNFFRFLGHNLDEYEDMQLSPSQARKIHHHLQKLSTGATAMVPMYCGGPRCPFRARCPLFEIGKHPLGKQCHPKNTRIYTSNGYKDIQDLNPETDKIVSYDNSCGLFKKRGRDFQIATREYEGQIYRIKTASGHFFECTHDHICVATWNVRALDLFAVYLMQKGNFWRVGKAKLFRHSGGKRYSGLSSRAQQEKCDKIWILGLYETNTEAMLAEEYFSVTWDVGKACFLDRPCYKAKKQEGLYKWVTQEQLDEHHRSMMKPLCHYAGLLREHGLDIEYPFWDRSADYRHLGGIGRTFEIRACNLFGGYMDMLTFNDGRFEVSIGNKHLENRGVLEPITLTTYYTAETVYSLDVEQEHTYVAGGIVTHNCLLEVQLIKEWIVRYFDEYSVDPNNFTEVGYISELAEIEILMMRINMNLSLPENSELVIDQVVAVGQDGTPILQKNLSPFMELRDRLVARKSRVIKLMVGDRQEKYKKEAALKMKMDEDPSSQQAALRSKLEALSRELESLSEGTGGLSPQAVIDAEFEDAG
jgi:hypothetical protein